MIGLRSQPVLVSILQTSSHDENKHAFPRFAPLTTIVNMETALNISEEKRRLISQQIDFILQHVSRLEVLKNGGILSGSLECGARPRNDHPRSLQREQSVFPSCTSH